MLHNQPGNRGGNESGYENDQYEFFDEKRDDSRYRRTKHFADTDFPGAAMKTQGDETEYTEQHNDHR
ncbi:hypothetical protein D3C83_245150 [compost metagenome]